MKISKYIKSLIIVSVLAIGTSAYAGDSCCPSDKGAKSEGSESTQSSE